jgi:MoaA/NifB/PqqE/SkfB family radical SAM enzyme
MGYEVHLPEQVLAELATPKPYVIITSGFFTEEIARSCRDYGLLDEEDFIAFTQIQQFDYQIDISGLCNLHCISCPRGNFEPQPKPGQMSAQTYERVLKKILREDPFVGAVSLYNWGEPLLNKELPDIIRISNDLGVHVAISSNLNIRRDFSDVIKAHPTWFRVSTSGVGKNYEITHTGGSWDLFYENLFKLRDWRAEYHPDLQVEVFFHIYRHNHEEDFQRIQELCHELGFVLRFRHAALAPLENIAAVIENLPMSDAAKRTMELQILPVTEAMDLARAQKDEPCCYERCLWITWDLKVSQCMEWFNPDLRLVPGDFLSTPLVEIKKAREESDFCRLCKERAIHRCYIVYGDEKLVHERGSLAFQA